MGRDLDIELLELRVNVARALSRYEKHDFLSPRLWKTISKSKARYLYLKFGYRVHLVRIKLIKKMRGWA